MNELGNRIFWIIIIIGLIFGVIGLLAGCGRSTPTMTPEEVTEYVKQRRHACRNNPCGGNGCYWDCDENR